MAGDVRLASAHVYSSTRYSLEAAEESTTLLRARARGTSAIRANARTFFPTGSWSYVRGVGGPRWTPTFSALLCVVTSPAWVNKQSHISQRAKASHTGGEDDACTRRSLAMRLVLVSFPITAVTMSSRNRSSSTSSSQAKCNHHIVR